VPSVFQPADCAGARGHFRPSRRAASGAGYQQLFVYAQRTAGTLACCTDFVQYAHISHNDMFFMDFWFVIKKSSARAEAGVAGFAASSAETAHRVIHSFCG
jgi:hypothetical protein